MRCARFLSLALLTFSLLLAQGLGASSARATGFGFTVEVLDTTTDMSNSVDSSTLTINFTDLGDGINQYELDSPFNASGSGPNWSIDSWISTTNVDPFVNNNFLMTNNGPNTQLFTVTVTQPIPPQTVDQFFASSATASVLDSNGNASATLAQSGTTPIYQAFINNAAGPFTLVLLPPQDSGMLPVTCAAAGCNATTSALPQAGAFAPTLATSIGITLTFELSPGDTASVLSRFEVVPEPGTALLLLSGLLGLAVARRR